MVLSSCLCGFDLSLKKPIIIEISYNFFYIFFFGGGSALFIYHYYLFVLFIKKKKEKKEKDNWVKLKKSHSATIPFPAIEWFT